MTKKFEFMKKIEYFVSDNVENNNTTMKHFDRRIRESEDVEFDFEERKLRCFGHTMNIVIRGLLFDSKVFTLKAAEYAITKEDKNEKGKLR